jgi:lantibiotic modifying enzyme
MSVVVSIAEELLKRSRSAQSIVDVGRGDAGEAVLFAYLAEACDETRYHRHVEVLLARCMEGIASDHLPAGLYGGFAGIAWAFAHLAKRGVASADVDLTEVDGALIKTIEAEHLVGPFDVVSGLSGLSVYAVERLPDPAAHQALRLIVQQLESRSVQTASGAAWKTTPELGSEATTAEFPDGHYDLGLAHGVPGVLAALSKACAAGGGNEATRVLIREVARWVLSQRLPDGSRSAFPHTVGPEPGLRGPSRLAWCYGDLGVAVALLEAAEAGGGDELRSTAGRLAAEAAMRTLETSGVADAGLCHGSGGLAVLFNRLYQATGGQALLDAARFWCRCTIAGRREGTGFAGYTCQLPPGQPLREGVQEGFLMGAAGIALALLAAATDIEPMWDRVLLCDVRPRAREAKLSGRVV